MESIEVSAPGKLVVIGEYAVLFGAPAVVAAIDRRAVVTMQRSSSDAWEVSAPGLAPQTARFDLGPGSALRWHDGALGRGSFGLVEKIIGGIEDVGGVELYDLAPLALSLDTRAFFEPPRGGTKLGLGSSAALTVALVTALEMWSAGGGLETSGRDRLQRLVDLHRAVQGGSGSGIDLAASLLGGVVRYRLDDGGSIAEVVPISLPDELRMIFVWTGRSASTGSFLERLEARLNESPREVRPVLDELAEISATGVAALAGASGGEFLDAVDDFWRALERLGEVIAMPILSGEHRALRRLAASCGVHYKPTGAGGGDFGIGFVFDAEAAMDFIKRIVADGFRTFDLRVDAKGVDALAP